MQSRPISDPSSWWFYAAIHGEYLLPKSVIPPPQPHQPDYCYLNWVNIKYIFPAAQLSKTPLKKVTNLFWDQCQHATWYFTPWHRGYLVAIENILRAIILKLGGPADWALPYWNYLNQSTSSAQANIPPAFTLQHLPDGSANPLFVSERYGLKIDVGNGEYSVHDLCQWDTIYNEGSTQGSVGAGDLTGYFYGGGKTGFVHSGGSETGDLEDNPHNAVHGMVGGENANNQSGIMGVPNTAALDPVFYLHHANIDRMWAAWNETGKNKNPADASWLAGPSAHGNPRFVMPLDSKGTPWYYTPGDVLTTTNLKYNKTAYSYTYDDLSLTSYDTTPPTQFRTNLLERFAKLNITGEGKDIQMTKKKKQELVGASTGSITLKSRETETSLQLNATAWKSVSKGLVEASFSSIPDEVFLQLEGVKGGGDTNFLSVYVNQEFVKSVSLFGLLSASLKGGAHGDAGLTFKFNITNIIDNLHLNGNIDVDSLNIQIKTKSELPDGGGITIGRIGVYRVSQ
ncbi:tyrosinase family protein [Mucilaginibacter dorajii]|nr:tyrosinase family protein [Mucilaginibacter dorajii]MCS3732852.1 tyrosinase [Mucilaginibacter dorajii]